MIAPAETLEKKSALIIGSSPAGLQAALDLADNGLQVHLVEPGPFMKNKDGTHLVNTRLLEVLRHANIRVWTNTQIVGYEQKEGEIKVVLQETPRYVNAALCTACGECIEVCPVTVPATEHPAIHLDGQPAVMAIDKRGRAPCASTCPAGIHVQGYIALIAEGRYQEAIDLIREAMPFPSVCGRVCNHKCELACTRGRLDESVNIMALKRFVADWEYNHKLETKPASHHPKKESTGKKVAIVGAGPAGLTAARDLLRLGYAVSVFDSLPVAGGMMRVGIPPHRLPSEILDWEINQIIDEGVDLQLNKWVDDIPGLLENGYDAVLIATGAHVAKKLPLRNSNHPDNLMSLDILKRACLRKEIDLAGKRVVVLGGGNVALDTTRTILRLGAAEVRMACLEPRGEMPGFEWEIEVAEEEGIQMYPGRTFKEIVVENDRIVGVRCTEINFHGFKDGRPNIEEIPGTEHIIPADLVVWAIGQMPNFSFLPQDGSINTRYPVGIQSDENMMTTCPGVFVAGDVHRGVTFFVVDAIGEGHRAAQSINRYINGVEIPPETEGIPMVEMELPEIKERFEQKEVPRRKRVKIASIPVEERRGNFAEVDLTLTESQARNEARRCLSCGVCSECLACEKICPLDAIQHERQASRAELELSAVLYTGDLEPLQDMVSHQKHNLYPIPLDDALGASAICAKVLGELANGIHPVPVAVGPVLGGGPARIGVFICQCGDRINQVVDTALVSQQISSLPDVEIVKELPFSCSVDASELIGEHVRDKNLNRVVLAACSCCNVNQVCFSCTFQRVRCKQNLGLFTCLEGDTQELTHAAEIARFEFVNIREQCAWVHADNPTFATSKAVQLVHSAVARSRAAPGKLAGVRHAEKSALLLGGGHAAQTCQQALSQQGITVHWLQDIPKEVLRTGGQYVVNQAGQTWMSSAIVLVPRSKREFSKLQAAFGRERRRPQPFNAWGGLETSRPGVFYCDPTVDPDTCGLAAASRLSAWFGRIESRPPIAAVVDPDRCRACSTCVDTCEYCAPQLMEYKGRWAAWIDPAICRGCGTCAVHCPSGAIVAGCSADAQLQAMLGAILVNSEPQI